MAIPTNTNVDNFDRWLALANEDPEAFEGLRRELIDAAIARAPKERRQRLRCLQWRIEKERDKAKTPMAACISISGMMWDALVGDNGLLDTLRSAPKDPLKHRGTLLKFPERQRD